MKRQLQWVIGGLALLIVGFVALQIYMSEDKQQFKEKHSRPEPKTETETEQPPEQVQVPEVDNRPPQPDDGREYVWHGDHWNEVPAVQKDASSENQQRPKVVDVYEGDTWRLYPDNTWRKGELIKPNEVPQKLILPEDVFSTAYTAAVKKLVQAYVEYRRLGDPRFTALFWEVHKVKDESRRLIRLYRSDKEHNLYARTRSEELDILLEPFQAMIPRRKHPTPAEKRGTPEEILQLKGPKLGQRSNP